ncbi:phage infection protein [Lacticaseibacillus daqingensis]|uniref:phage infection protein n=1 Tax=Lacticaseibacillus daqingensis TaxID=2486014 RepID=UPI000F79DC23|nr:phage infection protein [Lacticaseibacillus daqingensis]
MDHAAFLRRTEQFFAHEYRDRGMVKWQGFYLSDHTAALKREALAAHQAAQQLPEQSEAVVRATLAQALASGAPVQVQRRTLTPDLTLAPPLSGQVRGYTDGDGVMLDDQWLAIGDLRHAHILPAKLNP